MPTIDESLPTVISPDTTRGEGDPKARTPPGQTLTAKWPVLHYGGVPSIKPEDWSLKVWGLVQNPFELSWDEFNHLAKVNVKCDIHCVTHWSRLDNVFTGVAAQTIIELAKPLPEAKYVIQHAASDPGKDWTTNLPIEHFDQADNVIATHHDGEPISADHGAPVRVIVPRLYFWKGAKWVSGLEFVREDEAGFWEVNGYHMLGDPWREQRFGY